uniref:Vesicular integral-membrane protein VIP36-like n=1 Tax=Crassostrea virginica TaxID=6565 RepID=A0A8B8ETU7_CRAVI|nr:vesicular integral-membrane protein VIP36-like [Crassostrea virginica]
MDVCRWQLSWIVGLLLFLSDVIGDFDKRDYLKREHTLVKPYSGSGFSVPLWDFVGTTMVTNNYVRLTPDFQSRQGGIWNTMPLMVKNWELHVHFKVHGTGKNLFGDGFAVWYARDRNQLGPVFGNKDFFVGLAIFLDTYSNHNGPHNHEHPYISAMVNNGTLHYDHDRDGTHTEIAGCEAKFRNKDYDTYVAIRYQDETLKVSTDIDNEGKWKECFVVTGIKLPIGYYIGATAATGELADNHDIISMKLYELESLKKGEDSVGYQGLPSAQFFASPRDHVEDPKGGFTSGSMSGWKVFIIIIIAIIGLAVCGVVGYVVFNKDGGYNSKRFY